MSQVQIASIADDSRPKLASVQVVTVSVDELRFGASPRREGVDPDHVRRLAETGGDWPPILVWREGLVVVDGQHRVLAARMMRFATVAVMWFEGSAEEAYVASIRANITHGLPLTLRDRRSAALRVLSFHSDWSDSLIGEVCGLAAKTIANLRSTPASRNSPKPAAECEVRLGRDGRRRPVDAAAGRRRAVEALTQRPDASLREIARIASVSPETVRDVRQRLDQQEDALPRAARGGPVVKPLVATAVCGGTVGTTHWVDDVACRSTDEGRDFAEWFDQLGIDQADLTRFAAIVPLSRVHDVITQARARAADWAAFADSLRRRLERRDSRASMPTVQTQ